MPRRRSTDRDVRATFALVVVTGAAALDGCGGANHSSADRDAILSVMQRGRAALLAGNAHAACSTLTADGRRRALAFASGEAGPRPRTCEAVVRIELEQERRIPTFSADLRRARLAVKSVTGRRAVVRLAVPGRYGPVVQFRLTKTSHGWRIDDSDAVPVGD
jgi:hypothetical protein